MHRALGRGVPRPGPQAAPHVGRREPPAGLGEEQRRLVRGRVASAAARALQVAADARAARLAGGHEARLAALALDAHLLGVEVDRADVEVDELLGAQPARVGELEQRAVAQLERRRGRDAVEQRGDVGRLERARQRAAAACGAASRSAGLASISPCSTQHAEEARAAAASLRATRARRQRRARRAAAA